MGAAERVAVRAAVRRLPTTPGVYRFRDARGRVLYLGRATDLRHRVHSYWGDLRDRAHLSRMVARIDRVEAAACASVHEAAWLERNLLERGLPPWNRVAGGQEVPVWIVLDERPAAPGLSVVHSGQVPAGARRFGPYLGGARVRLAVSALGRVLPLAYAARSLSGAARDMARVRGVAPDGREALAATVAAVLDREPGAVESVRAELLRRRDGAAGALAFELAARLHEEIDALGWVVCAQRAALPEPLDAEVYGWAGGVLVHFAVRAGLMCQWRQRPCAEPAARERLGHTPATWRAFAQRNAELAAQLRL